jgi:hypothetical protein
MTTTKNEEDNAPCQTCGRTGPKVTSGTVELESPSAKNWDAKPSVLYTLPGMLKQASSSVAEIGFNKHGLFVRFSSGALYVYPTATAAEYEALASAESVGKHLQASIIKMHKGIAIRPEDVEQAGE